MIAGLDHVVILVADLEAAIATYRREGYGVELGGRHPAGTYNALIGLADGSYLELLAFHEPKPQSRWWTKLASGGGLIAACTRTENLRADVKTLRDAGLAMADPTEFSRLRPDGYRLIWTVSSAQGEYQDAVPFLIEDATPLEERIPKKCTHANGVTGIHTLTIAIRDRATLSRAYSRMLGYGGTQFARADLAAEGVRYVLGTHHLEFIAPTHSGGPTEQWLQARGPSPMFLTLRTGSGKVCALP